MISPSLAITPMANEVFKKVLNSLSFPVSRRKTSQLMKEAGVWVRYKKKYKATTNRDHKKPIYDNVLKQEFVAQKPDQA